MAVNGAKAHVACMIHVIPLIKDKYILKRRLMGSEF